VDKKNKKPTVFLYKSMADAIGCMMALAVSTKPTQAKGDTKYQHRVLSYIEQLFQLEAQFFIRRSILQHLSAVKRQPALKKYLLSPPHVIV